MDGKSKRILVVDDSSSVLGLIETILKAEGYEVDTVSNGHQAIERIEKEVYNMVLTDLMMPTVGGLEILEKVKSIDENTSVIILTAYGSVETAVNAMKAGAHDYITKPFNPDELTLKVARAFQREDLKAENIKLKEELGTKYKFKNIVGSSSAMAKVYEILSKVVNSKATILIQGESGTGKELIARAVHYSGPRKDKPFVKVDCTTIPEGLMESELFGHEKGAFTGAIRTKQGKFELADGGSIFLDEISEIKPDLQAKLLRVLQEREFERVGGTKTFKVDVRLIAATNRDLKKEMETGRFREDLYYRLNVIPVFVPPLRERKEDIPILVEHFIKVHQDEVGREVKDISQEALDLLMKYDWPGNVRELENAIERAMVMGSGSQIRPEHLPHQLQVLGKVKRNNGESEGETWPPLHQVEKAHILRTLEKVNWNRAKAAELLSIHRNTLRRKISYYGIDEGHEEGDEEGKEESVGQQSLPLNGIK